ncbi:MAG: hypothetical protein ABI315_14055 [Bacteroidia bacterium]
MKSTYFLLYFSLVSHFIFSQNFEYATIKTSSVSFGGNTINIRKDDGSGSYTKPHWTAKPANNSPVAYVSGNAPSVSASFTFECANAPTFVYIRGEASDSITFPSQKVTLTSTSGNAYKFDYPETVGSHIFTPGVVRFFKPFVINWQVSFDNGVTWGNIGETKNTLYVLYKTPEAEAGEFLWFHTVFDLSCRNAQYKTNEKDIIAAVWTEFTDHIVLNFNNDSLFYYKNLGTVNVTLAQLLKAKDAECYTFAELFLAAIKIQGVVRTNNYVNIAASGTACGGRQISNFIVKNWQFITTVGSAPCSDFAYSGKGSIKKLPGIPGSCTITPASSFGNHQVTKIDGIYYDPSYGTSYTSLEEAKLNSLAGWGILNLSGNIAYYYSKNLAVGNFKETITTY